jgi:hypothetical protein
VKKKVAAGKIKFNSHSTPGHQMDLGTWLVELALTRRNCGVRLPARFWTMTQYKFLFMREIKAVKSFMKKYGEKAVLNMALKNYLTTYTDYAQMEFHLQQTAESIARLALPKDTSPVVDDNAPKPTVDLRDGSWPVVKKKIGLFQALKEISNDDAKNSN